MQLLYTFFGSRYERDNVCYYNFYIKWYFKSLSLFLSVTSVTPEAAAISFWGIFSSAFNDETYSTVAAMLLGSFPQLFSC